MTLETVMRWWLIVWYGGASVIGLLTVLAAAICYHVGDDEQVRSADRVFTPATMVFTLVAWPLLIPYIVRGLIEAEREIRRAARELE